MNQLYITEAPIYNDTIPLCLVDSSETLELVGATNGTWSTPSQTSLCQQNVCTLTDLSYNLGGLYTFNSNTGSQRQVNVVIRGKNNAKFCGTCISMHH